MFLRWKQFIALHSSDSFTARLLLTTDITHYYAQDKPSCVCAIAVTINWMTTFGLTNKIFIYTQRYLIVYVVIRKILHRIFWSWKYALRVQFGICKEPGILLQECVPLESLEASQARCIIHRCLKLMSVKFK